MTHGDWQMQRKMNMNEGKNWQYWEVGALTVQYCWESNSICKHILAAATVSCNRWMEILGTDQKKDFLRFFLVFHRWLKGRWD